MTNKLSTPPNIPKDKKKHKKKKGIHLKKLKIEFKKKRQMKSNQEDEIE